MRLEQDLGEIAGLKLLHNSRTLPRDASPLHHLVSVPTGASKASKEEVHGNNGKKEGKKDHPIKLIRKR